MNSSIEIPYWLYIILIQFAVLLSVVSIFLFYKLKNSRIKIKTLERDQKTNTESLELTPNTESLELTPNTEDEEPAPSDNDSEETLQDDIDFLQNQIQALLKQEQQADMKDKHQIDELKRHLSEKNTAYDELNEKFTQVEAENFKPDQKQEPASEQEQVPDPDQSKEN